jgi:ATP-dependent Zn protease
MASENKVIFYSEELNEDIYQNTKLMNSKKIILENNEKEQINQNSYNTIVDTKDYLGCVNNNCSAINCNCSNSACHCSANIGNNSYNNSNNNNNSNNSCNSNNNSNTSKSNIEPAMNNYITKLFDFLFVLLLVGLLILIIYKRESLYLLYVLVITLLYIFIKFLMLSYS